MISIIITAKPVILLNIPSLMVFVQTTKYYYTSIICNDDIDSSTCTLVNVVELSSSKITKKKKKLGTKLVQNLFKNCPI